MSRQGRLLVIWISSVVVLAACAPGSGTATPPAAATPSPAALAVATVAPTPTPTPAPTPAPTDTVAPSSAPASASPSLLPGQLGGPLPASLWGTWRLKGTTGYWVFTANEAASYNDYGSTILGAGASGDRLSLGPRLDEPTACQKIGIYRWTLVSPKEFTIRPVKQDPCPRGQALLHADFVFESSSTAPLS